MSAGYDPNKLGWGAAIITCVLTAALGLTAYTIHNNTYRHPRDPMNVQVYHAQDMAKANEGAHGEAQAAEHAAGGEKAEPAEAKH